MALILRAKCKDFGKKEALVFGGLRIVLAGFRHQILKQPHYCKLLT